jgi:4a-hydroxytetrahydrobiopterin dehydratase
MASLLEERCEACQVGAPALTDENMKALQPEIPEWKVVEREGVRQLERLYKVKNFAVALALTNSIGELAEREGHHPAIMTEWGKVTVTWWTHKIGGLHRNDVVMAAKSDRLASELVESAS